MEEWIKKDSAIKAVCSGCLEENNTCRHGWDCPILTNLGRLPFIDRPQGEWIYGEHDVAMCDGYRCDRCGFFVPWDYEHKSIDFINDYNFCPHCGARMKGADDDK